MPSDVERIAEAQNVVRQALEAVAALRGGFRAGEPGCPDPQDACEADAGVELAYRHIEDATWRLKHAAAQLLRGMLRPTSPAAPVSTFDRSQEETMPPS